MKPTQIPGVKAVLMALLALVCLPDLLHGEDEPPAIMAELRFAATTIVEKKHTLWLRTGPGKDAVEVSLNTRSFSRPVKYKGPAVARFYLDQATAELEEPTVPASLSLKLKAGAFLVVVLPKTEGSDYRGYITPESDFPYGSFQFYNFSKAQILIRNDAEQPRVGLQPGENKVVRIKPGQQSMGILIAAKSQDKEPRVIRQTKFNTSSEWREMVLIFDNPKNERVSLRHFIDTRPVKR